MKFVFIRDLTASQASEGISNFEFKFALNNLFSIKLVVNNNEINKPPCTKYSSSKISIINCSDIA